MELHGRVLVCLKIGKVPITESIHGRWLEVQYPACFTSGETKARTEESPGTPQGDNREASTSICQVQPQLGVWQDQTSQGRDRTMKTTCVVAIPLPCPVLNLSRDLRRTWLWIWLPGYSTALPEHPWKASFLITPPTRIGMEGPSLIMG